MLHAMLLILCSCTMMQEPPPPLCSNGGLDSMARGEVSRTTKRAHGVLEEVKHEGGVLGHTLGKLVAKRVQ